MKTGRNISELAAEIERRANTRRDFVARTAALDMVAKPNNDLRLGVAGQEEFGIADLAHDQVATYTDIPRAYYGRLQSSHPALLAQNVNTLMQAKPDKRMVRTLDGHARAFLSDRYRCIDHLDLMENLLPTLMERRDLSFASAEVTDRRLYIKVISSELEGQVKAGDTVRMGLIISNSEVGLGSVMVAPFSERLVCTNGMVHLDYGKRKAHLGRAAEAEGEAWEMFTDETRKADDRAFFLKVRDTVHNALNGETLQRVLTDMREATGEVINTDPAKMVEAVGLNAGLGETERGSVLRNLIAGADLSRWGLANAITRTAQESESYDRATELEQLGGRLLNEPLPKEAEIERVTAVRRRTRREVVAAN